MKVPAPARVAAALIGTVVWIAAGRVARAAELQLGGVHALNLPYGQTLSMSLSGAPNKSAFIYYDVSPGPVPIAGELLPLGLTPALKKIAQGSTGPAGKLSAVAFLPEDPTLSGLTLASTTRENLARAAIEGMLCDGQKLDMSETHFADIIRQPFREFSPREPPIPFLGDSHP